ncbi:hypothetical protein NL676_039846 [Syzygium grande]|nr:hypothetical protein NL676_039846 [Syzygium grande]
MLASLMGLEDGAVLLHDVEATDIYGNYLSTEEANGSKLPNSVFLFIHQRLEPHLCENERVIFTACCPLQDKYLSFCGQIISRKASLVIELYRLLELQAPLLKSFMQVGSRFGENTLKLGSILTDGQVGIFKDSSAAALSTFSDVLPVQAAGLI